MSNEEASGDALSDADAERLSKRHRTEYHLLKIGLNAGKQNPNVDGQCLMNVGEMVGEAVNEPHGATASQSAGSSNSCAAAANSEIEQLGIDIDFVLNCGDAVDSKWAPSADADPEDDEAQYQLVVCCPADPLPCTSLAFIP